MLTLILIYLRNIKLRLQRLHKPHIRMSGLGGIADVYIGVEDLQDKRNYHGRIFSDDVSTRWSWRLVKRII